MPQIVRIDPDGTVTHIDGADLLGAAQAALGDALDVVGCQAPFFSGRLVGVIDDWGRSKLLPLNRKAWACYGRSPIFGPMFLAHDQNDNGHREPLDPALVTLLGQPIEEIIPARILKLMDEVQRNEGINNR